MADAETKRWIDAVIALGQDPRRKVPCPVCRDDFLVVTDIEADGAVVEQKLQCPTCLEMNYVRLGPRP